MSSRCDKTSKATGFKGYLQCHKCCIYCFVIQLSSEPDKVNCWYSLFKSKIEAWLQQLLVAIPGQIKTKIQNCLKLIYLQNERYTSQGKNATLYLSDLNSCWVQYIFCQLFLVYNLVQDRDSTKFSDSKEEYKTFLFLMYFLISSECLFYGRQLKALELFEAKVCISFQQGALVYNCERLKKLFVAW